MPQDGKHTGTKRLVSAILGVVLGAAFIVFCPDIGLGEQGVRCLGILLGAVVWWVGATLPTYGTAIVMVVLFYIVAGVDSAVALSGFVMDIWWLLVAAFGLGAGMKESGLLKRMALAIVRVFPKTFSAQAAGLMAAGTLVGPLVPSMAAKVTMLTPLAMGVGDALGYKRFGKRMQGLFLAVFCGVRSVAPAVVSASVIGYCMLGLLPADVQANFDFLHWLLAALPWFAIVTALTYASIVVLYRTEGGRAEREELADGADLDGGGANMYASPGPMSLHEKQMCAIVLTTVVMWIAEPLHHIPPHIVALAAFALVIACRVLPRDGFRNDISWEALVFVGIALGLSNVFQVAGIQDWVVQGAGPAFDALVGNRYLFVVGAALATIVLRFLIVSETAYLNIVMVFLVPLSVSAGVSPWVVGFAMYAVITPWFVMYQSVTYLAAFYSVNGQMVHHSDMVKYCALYTLFCVVGLAASVPYWQWMGLL